MKRHGLTSNCQCSFCFFSLFSDFCFINIIQKKINGCLRKLKKNKRLVKLYDFLSSHIVFICLCIYNFLLSCKPSKIAEGSLSSQTIDTNPCYLARLFLLIKHLNWPVLVLDAGVWQHSYRLRKWTKQLKLESWAKPFAFLLSC